MRRTRMRTKLFLAVLAVTVPALVVVGALAYLSGKAAVTRTTFDHLTSVRASKANQIESYFRQIRAQAQTLSEGLMAIEAMREFTGGLPRAGGCPAGSRSSGRRWSSTTPTSSWVVSTTTPPSR